jgi:hypothetical protein
MLMTAGTVAAQQQQLTMPAGQMSVMDVLAEIRRQADLGVVYNSTILDTGRTVDFPRTALTVDEAIEVIVGGANIVHSYEGRIILLTKAPKEEPKAAEPKAEPPYTAEGYEPSKPSDFDTPLGNRPVREEEASTAPVETRQPTEPTKAPIYVEADPVSHWRDAGEYKADDALPKWAIKTNLLYGLGTLTPNVSVEMGLGKRTTLELGGSYNPWNLKGSVESNRKLVHMLIKPEFRYWLCERFSGHFFGAHILYGRYNIGTYQVPLLFDKEYRYDGHAIGGGITYGYNLPLAKRWNLEFAIGIGALWMTYDRFDCAACNTVSTPDTKVYFGPTNAAVSLEFLIK